MGKKRKRIHFDRSEVLSSLAKKPNISCNVSVVSISGGMGYYERHFTHKLCVDDDAYLDAMVMKNGICVLFYGNPLVASCLKFPIGVETMSGRRKKGARKIKADTVVCEATLPDGNVLEMRTPVGGQLLEVNDLLIESSEKLGDMRSGERYIAVIYPDTEIPSANQSIGEWRAVQEAMMKRSNICYSWLRGNCHRGSSCKFEHTDESSCTQTSETNDN
eukprot:CAMPEP_0185023734 /NCGR_PEP_ID=MMETSP1103-20130426/6372_1 /TAXON_ID=36769 /ORGANISM="Paraphysomonas bandaiensis, Strain Caron Lab Isolate" /LENGTH=217 /DNA_ID=CAMNT_0027556465 /DNA_START=61 /DNA_END=711 /DNA_ORIENTATION=+